MKTAQNVFLVGPMGAGKTTIGRYLAKNLDLEFIDLDAEIERRCGADIPWIFDVEGEAGFRKREAAVLEEITLMHRVLLATGGGAVLSAENRQYLSQRGFVVYLDTSVAQLVVRTHKDKKRPLLQVDDPEQVIVNLLGQRDPLYREVADLIVSTENKSPQDVAREIEEKVRS